MFNIQLQTLIIYFQVDLDFMTSKYGGLQNDTMTYNDVLTPLIAKPNIIDYWTLREISTK